MYSSKNKPVVDLWTTRLIATASEIEGHYQSLSQDEKQRADRFHFKKHRDRFVIGRALLRVLLGAYLGQLPESIRFRYGPKDKPALAGESGPALHFNLAHSEDCVLYGVSSDCELGVDVELVREMPDAESIAGHFFAQGERDDLLSLPPEQRAQAFFNCWTRKEAYLKAIGDGLSAPLDQFQVSLKPGQPAAFLKFQAVALTATPWTLVHLLPLEGYVGALAVPSQSCAVQAQAFRDAEEFLEYLRQGLSREFSPADCESNHGVFRQ